jgi:hypothetical protein
MIFGLVSTKSGSWIRLLDQRGRKVIENKANGMKPILHPKLAGGRRQSSSIKESENP